MEHLNQLTPKSFETKSWQRRAIWLLLITVLMKVICWTKAGVADSIAANLGILKFCGTGGGGGEQLRAQHDVIGAAWLRMMGFAELVPHVVEGHVLAKR